VPIDSISLIFQLFIFARVPGTSVFIWLRRLYNSSPISWADKNEKDKMDRTLKTVILLKRIDNFIMTALIF
jgi:hypothetical protein